MVLGLRRPPTGESETDAKVRYHFVLILLACSILGCLLPTWAQQQAQWIPGQDDLNAGILPDPGLTYANLTINYSAGSLRNAKGSPVPVVGTFGFWAIENVVDYGPKVKILGGEFAAQIMMPTANAAVTLPKFGVNAGGTGYSDTWVQPATLGWNLKHVDTWLAYAFMAPTGRFAPGATNNVGSGYWGNDIVSGTTVYLTKNKKTTANLATDWEIHCKKQGTNETPGQAFTMEWGLGQMFPLDKKMTRLLQLGVIGYDQWQVSDDGGTLSSGVPARLIPFCSVHAMGVQSDFLAPTKNLVFFFKFEPEYLAYSHTQGRTIVFGGSWTWGFPRVKTTKL
jgi:hypothetical protein